MDFMGVNQFEQVEAENATQAFCALYRRLRETFEDITALKVDGQDYMLGLSATDWAEIEQHGISVKEGYPEGAGVQIQILRDTPIY
jgi:hypothetical protein